MFFFAVICSSDNSSKSLVWPRTSPVFIFRSLKLHAAEVSQQHSTDYPIYSPPSILLPCKPDDLSVCYSRSPRRPTNFNRIHTICGAFGTPPHVPRVPASSNTWLLSVTNCCSRSGLSCLCSICLLVLAQ